MYCAGSIFKPSSKNCIAGVYIQLSGKKNECIASILYFAVGKSITGNDYFQPLGIHGFCQWLFILVVGKTLFCCSDASLSCKNEGCETELPKHHSMQLRYLQLGFLPLFGLLFSLVVDTRTDIQVLIMFPRIKELYCSNPHIALS